MNQETIGDFEKEQLKYSDELVKHCKKDENSDLTVNWNTIKDDGISIFEKRILYYPELKNLKGYY